MEGSVSSEDDRFLTEDKRKGGRCHYGHAKAGDGCGSLSKHVKAVNSHLGLVCPSHVFVGADTPNGCPAGNSRIAAKLSLAFYHKTLDCDESRFPEENFKTPGTLPSLRLSDPARACLAASQDPGIPQRSRRVSLTQGRAASNTAPGRCTAHSAMFEVCAFSSEKFFELKEMKQNKTRQQKPDSEPKVTLGKLQIWKLIHLPAHRHPHLECLYLYPWTQALCSVEAF